MGWEEGSLAAGGGRNKEEWVVAGRGMWLAGRMGGVGVFPFLKFKILKKILHIGVFWRHTTWANHLSIILSGWHLLKEEKGPIFAVTICAGSVVQSRSVSMQQGPKAEIDYPCCTMIDLYPFQHLNRSTDRTRWVGNSHRGRQWKKWMVWKCLLWGF